MAKELTLSIIKPDAVKRCLTGKINTIFESNKLTIVAQKMILLSKTDAKKFYNIHKDRAFFNDLCDYMTSAPVIVQVLKGKNAVENYRMLMGSTDPKNAEEGTIRKAYALGIQENSVHGSDSLENAKLEIDYFFNENEVID